MLQRLSMFKRNLWSLDRYVRKVEMTIVSTAARSPLFQSLLLLNFAEVQNSGTVVSPKRAILFLLAGEGEIHRAISGIPEVSNSPCVKRPKPAAPNKSPEVDRV